MKDKSMWIVILLIAVVAVFAINPDIIKQDDKDVPTSFAVATEAQEEIQQQNTTSVYSSVVTEIRCLDLDDCVEEVRAQGNTEEIRASCVNEYCVFQMERLAVGGNVE